VKRDGFRHVSRFTFIDARIRLRAVAAQPTLLLFPGLGADARVFAPQLGIPARLEVVEWPEPLSESEMLSDYAARIARGIGSRPDLYVGGVSLGAMVALEVARPLAACGVFLIGGCWSHRQIAPLFKAVLALGGLMPPAIVRASLAATPLALKIFEHLDADQIALMTRVLRDHSPRQIRWSCRALLRWECCALPPDVPVYAIHGEKDEVVPLRNIRADHVVPEGHHLINLSHPNEVNAFIATHIGTSGG
jgi:pimeloyl-ACP methyl ester carboxylesterase